VPGIVDAACNLFSRHGVSDIAETRADAKNLTATTDAILAAIAEARRHGQHVILFVTGIPGAGKTLCGRNAVIGVQRDAGATFLTGNPTLVHVLREALARDAADGDRGKLRAARQQTKAAIQALPAFRDHHVRSLRQASRGRRRCGLLASSGARRLRADGLGAELPHIDAGAVAHWFLDRWPEDIRASDALELLATEFSCQGLELDYVGLCWAGDLSRVAGRVAWQVRDFKGTRWQTPAGAEVIANRLNTYRVLLTRARYETFIWVPRGDASDPTRPPASFDAIADFLGCCGVGTVEGDAGEPEDLVAQPILL
jgi:hypothetical protein